MRSHSGKKWGTVQRQNPVMDRGGQANSLSARSPTLVSGEVEARGDLGIAGGVGVIVGGLGDTGETSTGGGQVLGPSGVAGEHGGAVDVDEGGVGEVAGAGLEMVYV